MRDVMGELLAQLRRASVNGVVPEEVFARNARALGLGRAAQNRLRGELARLGLPVQGVRVHVDADSPDVETVAPSREENVSPRVGRARALLARYEDAGGYVSSRALEGVIRLAGMTSREAGELRAAARVRREGDQGVNKERDTPEASIVAKPPVAKPLVVKPLVVKPAPMKPTRVQPPEVKPAPVKPVPHEADWEQARRLSARFRGGIDWLAEYALLALGSEGLALVLGPAAAVDVAHALRGIRTPGQQVLAALEALQRVFDSLKESGLCPKDFFERPAAALDGLTPYAFLAKRPLVHSVSRLAVRDALREMSAGPPKGVRWPR
ncbi:hypothetical protein ACFWIN_00715 [Streptomyces sp. NPDC127049]|uniref:hypothetical protein n=1 Tax=Streptomyces sp. NPDC127049 TaxID=3347118 RepID=UPI003660F869